MNTLTILAVAATGMALGGVTVASWHQADHVRVSLLRAHRVNDQAALDDWDADCWWELSR